MKLLNFNTILALALLSAVNGANADLSRDQLKHCFVYKTAAGCADVVDQKNAVMVEGDLREVKAAKHTAVILEDSKFNENYKQPKKQADPNLKDPRVLDSVSQHDYLISEPEEFFPTDLGQVNFFKK